jgi:hypothetical protein
MKLNQNQINHISLGGLLFTMIVVAIVVTILLNYTL